METLGLYGEYRECDFFFCGFDRDSLKTCPSGDSGSHECTEGVFRD